MNENSTFFFNVVTVVFVVLTLLVGFAVLSIAAGTMDTPFLAPDNEDPLPTEFFAPTFTPSPMPGAELTPVETPMPEAQ